MQGQSSVEKHLSINWRMVLDYVFFRAAGESMFNLHVLLSKLLFPEGVGRFCTGFACWQFVFGLAVLRVLMSLSSIARTP